MRALSNLSWLLVALVLVPLAAAQAAPPIETLLPGDTQMIVLVRDMPTLRAKWAKHPLSKTMEDEQVRKFFAPMLKEMDLADLDATAQKDFGMSFDEVLATFDGSMVMAFTDFTAFPNPMERQVVEWDAEGNEIEPPAEPTQPAPMIAIVEIGDQRAKVEQMITKARAKEAAELADAGYTMSERVEKLGDHTLHLQSYTHEGKSTDTSGWAIVGDYAVLGGTHDLLRATVKRIDAANPADSLATSANYKEFLAGSPDADAMVYVNVQSIVGKVMADYKAQKAAEAANADPDAPPAEDNPFDVTPEKIVNALGVDTMRGAGMRLAISDAHTDLDAVVNYSERKGLMKLIAFTDGPVPMPKMIPATAIMAGSTNFSVNQFWTELWNVMGAISPMVAMMGGQGVAAMNQETGIDLHRDLIKPLGDHMLTATFFRAPAKPGEAPSLERTDTLYMLELKDAPTFTKAIDTLILKAEQDAVIADPDAKPEKMFTTREYLGVKIHEMTTPAFIEGEEDSVFAYAITDKYAMLAVGSAAPIETVLVNQKQGIESVWQKPAVAAALKDMPPNASAVGYTDLKSVAGSIVALAKQMATAGLGNEVDLPVDPEADLDPAKLGEHLGPAIGAIYADDKHMAYKFRMVHDNAE